MMRTSRPTSSTCTTALVIAAIAGAALMLSLPVDAASPTSLRDAIRTSLRKGAEDVSALRKQADNRVRDHLANWPDKLNRAGLIDDAAVRQFLLRLHPAADSSARRDVAAWLTGQERLFFTLCLAISEHDDAGAALDILAALREGHGKQLNEYASLATALCLTWDQPIDPQFTAEKARQRANEIFAYFTGRDASPRYDLGRLPWQVLVHLVDIEASIDELRWARQRKSRVKPSVLGKVYFDVEYDKKGLYFGSWQGIKGKPYTLENIKRAGGVCKDQAYYAIHVCRALGVPATKATGRSGRGVGFHSWVGYLILEPRKPPRWDFDTARYEEYFFWSGEVTDPQTRRPINDADVALTAELCAAGVDDRLLAEALTSNVTLVDSDRRAALLKAAIELAPGHASAWLALADHYAAGKFDFDQLEKIARVVHRFTDKRFDEFGYHVLVRMIEGLPHDDKLRALTQIASGYKHRPDLVARARIAQGDVLVTMGRSNRALTTWSSVITGNLSQPPLVLEAMDRIDAQLRKEKAQQRLAVMYRSVWSRMPKPKATGYAWTTPWYLVGQRYAQLLEEMGEDRQATAVKESLSTRDTRPPDAQTRKRSPEELRR